MSRSRTRVQGVGYDAPQGGKVNVAGEATAVGPMKAAPEGWAFGPLQVDAPAGRRVVLDELRYEQSSNTSFLDSILSSVPFAGLLLPAACDRSNPPPEQDDVSRRDFLAAGVAALGGAALAADTARAADQLTLARIEIAENDHGMALELWDDVESVLPTEKDYLVVVDGVPVDDFAVDDSAEIPAGTTGTATVRTDGDLDLLTSLRWSASGEEELSYEFELDQSAADYTAGETVVVSEQSMITQPLLEAGADAATMVITGTSIPHRDEDATSVGQYYVREDDEALVYEVGERAPAGQHVTLRVHTGRLTELWDDISR